MSAHREAFELYRRAVNNMPDDLGDLERARLLENYGYEALAIEENDVGEQAFLAARSAFTSAGRPELAALMVSAILTVWRRTGRPLQERDSLVRQGEAELQGLESGPEVDEAAMNLAFDRLVIEVDANALATARRTGKMALADVRRRRRSRRDAVRRDTTRDDRRPERRPRRRPRLDGPHRR